MQGLEPSRRPCLNPDLLWFLWLGGSSVVVFPKPQNVRHICVFQTAASGESQTYNVRWAKVITGPMHSGAKQFVLSTNLVAIHMTNQRVNPFKQKFPLKHTGPRHKGNPICLDNLAADFQQTHSFSMTVDNMTERLKLNQIRWLLHTYSHTQTHTVR